MRCLLGLPAVMVGACATVDARRDFERVAEQVQKATGQNTPVPVDDQEEIERQVQQMLADGLSVEEAAAICLLNNPKLTALYFKVGIARADLVQSQLLRNPTLSLAVRFPDGGGLANVMVDFAQNIADLWQIPVRKEAAEFTLDQTILEVARELGIAVLDAKSAFFRALAADRLRGIAQENVGIAQDSLEAALVRQRAGAGNEIEVNLARSEALETDLSFRSAGLAAYQARRDLALLLGLTILPDRFTLVGALPDPPAWKATADDLVLAAESHRMDVLAANRMVEAAEANLLLERRRVFPMVELGFSFERESRPQSHDGNPVADALRERTISGEPTGPIFGQEEDAGEDVVFGPSFGLELPLFDQNQAAIAKAHFMFSQSRRLAESLRRQVVQEVFGAYEGMRVAADNLRFYRDQVLPLRETNLQLTREGYRAGKTSFLAVLEAQRVLLSARARQVELQQAAAVALTELEKVTGEPLAKILAEGMPTKTGEVGG